ncbi:MarR family transcriptional regulator [Acetobacter sp. DsW_063]|nr:MarR family transcriptional regulator [Acetobacter sp. DsW_063]OUJ15147.1 MarR family transcriptional regulator [Acetobacter sp. DsW_063]
MPCPPPLDAHLCYAIYSANIAINRAYRPVLDRLGVTYPQYLVMSVLWERDGQSVGEIAGRLALESSTITPLVKRLEGAGFVRRERNPQDERQVIVTLSPQGVALRQDAACVGETLLSRSDLSIAELTRLNDEIRRFRDVLIANTPDAE